MFEHIRCDDFIQAHKRLEEFFYLKLRHDLCEGAKKHINHGLIIRLRMMDESIQNFDRKMGKSDKPLSHDLAVELTLFLNAYYVNLVGSLDNLAWALIYQHNLIENVDENNKKHRRLAQLFNKDFLKLLRANKLESLSILLEPVKEWDTDIREFRDPAAHRIPLYIPPAIFSVNDIQQSKKMDEQAALLIDNGDWKGGVDLIHKSQDIGQHVPVFIVGAPEIKVYHLAKKINDDHERWLKVINDVLQEGFQTLEKQNGVS